MAWRITKRTNTASTTLSRPGMRTLWCRCPILILLTNTRAWTRAVRSEVTSPCRRPRLRLNFRWLSTLRRRCRCRRCARSVPAVIPRPAHRRVSELHPPADLSSRALRALARARGRSVAAAFSRVAALPRQSSLVPTCADRAPVRRRHDRHQHSSANSQSPMAHPRGRATRLRCIRGGCASAGRAHSLQRARRGANNQPGSRGRARSGWRGARP
jgi:hypothetical protein